MENTIAFAPQPRERSRSIELVPRTRNQERLVMALLDWDLPVVVTLGPAGTGKTYLAMQAAVRALQQREIERIVLTRPAVGVEDERHGFLPGNLVAKMEPWTRPLLDVLREHYRPQDIQGMIEDQIVEIAPLAFMRGRTFRDAWIVGDEMQNATPAQVKMLLTRIGSGSRIVITGDVEQADRQVGENGLLDLATRLRSRPCDSIRVCEFTDRDIQRHAVIKSVLDLYAAA
jgi:phosphate starvation-inducible protein PhoH and related proteins